MGPERLLVVDDDSGIRKFFCHVAEHLGYEVEWAEDGKTFMNIFERFDPSVIIVDMFMPAPNGFDLVRLLGERECRSGLILVSGYDRVHLKSAGEIASGLHFRSVQTLTKPVSVEELKSAILSA